MFGILTYSHSSVWSKSPKRVALFFMVTRIVSRSVSLVQDQLLNLQTVKAVFHQSTFEDQSTISRQPFLRWHQKNVAALAATASTLFGQSMLAGRSGVANGHSISFIFFDTQDSRWQNLRMVTDLSPICFRSWQEVAWFSIFSLHHLKAIVQRL